MNSDTQKNKHNNSLSVYEICDAIQTGNANLIKAVKGIGAKTAQRIVVDLKDKVKKLGVVSDEPSIVTTSSPVRSESISALVMLGFLQSASAKVVDKVLKENPSFSVEQTIKMALKLL